MATTPDTSFSSDELKHGRAAKSGRISTPPGLSSPSQSSDADAAADDDDANDDGDGGDAPHEAIQQAYKAIWRSFCGLPAHDSPRPTFYLKSQQSYERLYQRLDERDGLLQYFEDSIRKSWDCETGKLVLDLMAPSPLHASLARLIDRTVQRELNRISDTFPALRPFCDKIEPGGDGRIRKASRRRAPKFEACPDEQWHYDGRYPSFVLEVAYSQDGEDLDDKITGFLNQLHGRICNVLGVDVTYLRRGVRSQSSHSASVSLWTTHEEEDGGLRIRQSLYKQVFRTEDGQAQPGDLVLPLDLFVPLDIRSQLPDLGPEAHVCISFACLSDLVSRAERRQRLYEGTASPSPEPQQQRRKRVTLERADGTEEMLEQMPSKRRRAKLSGQEVGEEPAALGRTRSQSRSASQPRRSERVRRSQSANRGSQAPD